MAEYSRPASSEVTWMPKTDVVAQLIVQLRAEEFLALEIFGERARRLADHLEWRIGNPKNDGFDIARTGDDDADRTALADWLFKAARAGPHLAPPWTRSFSEAVAWLVRNKHDLRIEALIVGANATYDAALAQVANERGIDAAYDVVKARPPISFPGETLRGGEARDCRPGG